MGNFQISDPKNSPLDFILPKIYVIYWFQVSIVISIKEHKPREETTDDESLVVHDDDHEDEEEDDEDEDEEECGVFFKDDENRFNQR